MTTEQIGARVRINSAHKATRNAPRHDDDLPAGIDFARGARQVFQTGGATEAAGEVVELTRSLGRKLRDEPETFAWRDESGAEVEIEFDGGRCRSWQLTRSE